jgi:hypothetical protein
MRYVADDDDRYDGVRWDHLRIPRRDNSDHEDESTWCSVGNTFGTEYQLVFAEQSHRVRIICQPEQPVRRMVNFFANHANARFALVSWKTHGVFCRSFSVFNTHGCWNSEHQNSSNMVQRLGYAIADYCKAYNVNPNYHITVISREGMASKNRRRGRY